MFVKEKFKNSLEIGNWKLCQLFEMTLSILAALFQISKKSRVLVITDIYLFIYLYDRLSIYLYLSIFIYLYLIVHPQFTRYTLFNSQSCNLFLLNVRSVWILRIECKRK